MVKKGDCLYLNKEIHFAKPLKISWPSAGRSSGIKTVLNNSRRCLHINLLNMIPRSPTISNIYTIYTQYI